MFDLERDAGCVGAYRTLPHPQGLEPSSAGEGIGAGVMLAVAPHLVEPQVGVGSVEGRPAVGRAAMPEAPINEHRQSCTRKHDVWGTAFRQGAVEAVPEPKRVKRATEFAFRRCAGLAPAAQMTSSVRRNPLFGHCAGSVAAPT